MARMIDQDEVMNELHKPYRKNIALFVQRMKDDGVEVAPKL